MTAPTALPSGEITGWTAARALAALWVVLFHFKNNVLIDSSLPVLAKGYLGVDLFFILSGLVIAHVYLGAVAQRSFSFRAFVIKRLARIYPVHLVTLLPIIAIIMLKDAFPELGGHDRAVEAGDVLLNLTLLHSFGFASDLSLNYPSWSISSEMLAYLLAPALFLLILKAPAGIALGGTAAILVAIVTADAAIHDGMREVLRNGQIAAEDHGLNLLFTRSYDGAFARAVPEFALGAALYRVLRAHEIACRPILGHPLAAPVAFAAIVISLFAGVDLVSVLLFALFLACLCWQSLRAGPMQYIGRISYSLYMGHALVQIVFFDAMARLFAHRVGEADPVFLLPAILVVIAFGALLYHAVEKPCRSVLVRRLTNHGDARKAE